MQNETLTRVRGVQSARALPRDQSPGEVVSALADTLHDFIARNDRAIDDINSRLAANTVGGARRGDSDTPGSVRAAQESFGRFAKTGMAPKAAMQTDDDSKGGYLVQPELEKTITRRQADLSPMRRLARVQTTTSGEYQIPLADGGVDSGWVGERQARPETDGATLAMLTITAHEIYANPAITQKMLDDAVVDIGAYLSDEITLAFDEKEGDAFVNGNGVNKPRGFLQYPTATDLDATRARGTLQFRQTAASGAIAPDDLLSLLYDLRAGYRAGSVWLMNSATAGVVRKLKDADGNHIWSLASTPGELPMLLGYPVEIDEGMPAVAAGAFPVAFGNFQRGYIVVDRLGIRVLRDDLTNKPYVHFYTTKRVGGAVHDDNAIKLLKIKA